MYKISVVKCYTHHFPIRIYCLWTRDNKIWIWGLPLAHQNSKMAPLGKAVHDIILKYNEFIAREILAVLSWERGMNVSKYNAPTM